MTKYSALAEILHQEHLITVATLSTLEERVFGPQKNKPIDTSTSAGRAEVQAVLDLIEHEIHQHFRFEEEDLFPAVAERGYAELARLLEQEHDAIRTLAGSLKDAAVSALAEGFDQESWQAYREAGMDLIPSAMFHIQKEETAVIERLTVFLPAETDRALAEKYSRSKQSSLG